MIRVMTVAATAIAMAGAVSGCAMNSGGTTATATPARTTTAVLRMADGTEVGRAVATETGGGIRVAIDVSKLPAGPHGAHVHTTGRCDGPDFTTAGGHWNPTAMKHGTQNPMGPHAGDLPNLTIGANGRGKLTMMLPAGTMTDTGAGLMDTDGSAFVIHAAADDLKTDPSGNSGGRVACGVFEPS